MFKNKHIITALIVTPLLAIAAYFATDYLVSERPQPAQVGGQYPLAALPNCRYASGQCGLQNGNFKIVVQGTADDSGMLALQLRSKFALDEAFVSVVSGPSEAAGPVAMQADAGDGTLWQLTLPVVDPQRQYLRVVVTAAGAVYYAETAMPFLNYQTSYNKDFR